MSTRGSPIIENRPSAPGSRYRWYYISSDAGEIAKQTLEALVHWANRSSPVPTIGQMDRHLKELKYGHLFQPTENGEHPFDRDQEGRFSPFNEYEYRVETYGPGYRLITSEPFSEREAMTARRE